MARFLPVPRAMNSPHQPLERIPPSAFRPPFCPRRGCVQHKLPSPRRFRYRKAGYYTRGSDNRRFPQFQCLACGSRFIQPAFCVSYYSKRPELIVPIAAGLVAGSAHRQIARSIGCAPSTVTRLAARLGRHALLFHASQLDAVPEITESVGIDHFETFVVRQEEALGLATPVGRHSWFIYGVDPAPHRRGGKRTPAQQEQLRRKPVRVPRNSYLRSTRRTLELLLNKVPEKSVLHLASDDHPAYRKAIATHPERNRIKQRIYRNPPRGAKGSKRTKQARIRDREMRALDVLHGLLRHTCAHHRRETIAFGRRVNAVLERMMLTIVWRNFIKKVTERRTDRMTAARMIGLTEQQWSWEQVFARRLFPARVKLPPGWMKVYRRNWITESIGANTKHRLRYAY